MSGGSLIGMQTNYPLSVSICISLSHSVPPPPSLPHEESLCLCVCLCLCVSLPPPLPLLSLCPFCSFVVYCRIGTGGGRDPEVCVSVCVSVCEGWGVGGVGVERGLGRETEGLCLTLRCHHQNDARIKTGSGVGLFKGFYSLWRDKPNARRWSRRHRF